MHTASVSTFEKVATSLIEVLSSSVKKVAQVGLRKWLKCRDALHVVLNTLSCQFWPLSHRTRINKKDY